MESAVPANLRESARPRFLAAVVLWAAGLVFYSFVAAPVPATNEAHYLAKARHVWQPEWCAGDMFLESANAHSVFYWTLGALTAVLPLPVVAVICRVLVLTLFAAGWLRLGRALGGTPRTSILAGAIFLALQTVGNWSGEWVIGGIESKVVTYACLLWAAAAFQQQKFVAGSIWLGIAIAFHPVVGGWGLLAFSGGAFLQRLFQRSGPWLPCSWTTAILSFSLLVLVASAGLIPAVRLLLEPVDATTKYAGTYLQVFYRLSHHLDPMTFPWRAHAGFAILVLVLVLVWLISWRCCSPQPTGSPTVSVAWLQWVVACSLLIAVAGLIIGVGPRPPQQMTAFAVRMQLMKFYPFRLADALVPCALAWMMASLLVQRWPKPRATGFAILVLMTSTCAYAAAQAQEWRVVREHASDWQDVCRWFRDHTPRDSLVQTPHDRSSFKWYAERPEYVTFKDCPQDTPGIVEWNRRLRFLSQWYQQHFADGSYSTAELNALSQATGITHLVTDRLGPIEQVPVYQNTTFRVYDLRDGSAALKDRNERKAD